MGDLDRLKGAIVSQVDGNSERLAALAHEIYLHPETGLNEVRTSALLADLLEGIQINFSALGPDVAL